MPDGANVSDSAEAATGSSQSDVAVVFVHGIGSQKSGATLNHWSEFLKGLLDHVAPDCGLKMRLGNVVVVGDSPEVNLEIARDDGRKATWLLTDATWSESFHPSRASDVLRWCVRFSRRAASRLFLALLGQFWFVTAKQLWPMLNQVLSETERPYESRVGAPSNGLAPIIMGGAVGIVILFVLLVPHILLFGILFIVAPILFILSLVLALVLLAVQRVPVIKKTVAPIIASLVTSVGDAQVYREQSIQAAAMRQVIQNRVDQASSRAKSVVVVAHSQGAAISCRAFLREEVNWPTVLITIGAGTALLNEDNSVAKWCALGSPRWINIWTPLDPVPSGPMGDDRNDVRNRMLETLWEHTQKSGFRATSHDGVRELTWVPGMGPRCWSGTSDLVERARRSRGRFDGTESIIDTQKLVSGPLDEQEAILIADVLLRGPDSEAPVYEWIELPYDRPTRGPEERPVANHWSVIRDHTTYAENLTQVQYPLARLLLDEAPATRDSLPPLPARSEDLHMVRVRSLAMSRLISAVTAAAIVSLLVALGYKSAVLDAATWAAGHSKTAESVLGSLSDGIAALAMLTMVGLAVFFAISRILGAAGSVWHRQETLRLLVGEDGPRYHLGVRGKTFFACYLIALAFSSAYWVSMIYPAVEFTAVVGYLLVFTYLLWALVWPFIGLRPKPLPPRT
ncbi:hypothetical protein ACFWBN_20560 [Streptomyces sp. NPDC059989]|uniref:hypothetical protein n=1 Tax=Streptomyces sp. NPDC059989 TaxID=3347026 RepID=UPI0036AA3F09